MAISASGHVKASQTLPSGRPPPKLRAFTSPIIEQTIAGLQRQAGDTGIAAKLGRMVAQCLPNTLDTTVELGIREGRPDTFVITGDIPAMWLRDSTAQVWPYLRFAKEDPGLRHMLRGVVERQTACVLLDPYANAFNRGPTPSREHSDDDTLMKPGVFERKWELDSLCCVMRLAHGYWHATGDGSPFDERWRESTRLILRTLREQQRKSGPGPYHFQRRTSWNPDSAPGNGYGNPIRPVGLIVSLFRPSDDAAVFPFLIPANMFAVVALRNLAQMLDALGGSADLAADCRALADEVAGALSAYAIDRGRPGRSWAYEVDGFGNALFMDDANVPSLLSLPYLGWCTPDNPLYVRTRAMVLSDSNPYFHRGCTAEGVGSPHAPGNRVWPLSIIMRALTSTDDKEISDCLQMLAATDANTGFMHEAYDPDDPARYSRPWFAWANSLFGELMLETATRRPWILRRLR